VAAEQPAVTDLGRARSFFERAWDAGEAAPCAETYRIMGRSVRIRAAENFGFACRALAHLRTEPAPAPSLDIRSGDQHSFVLPDSPWRPEDFGVRGEIRGGNDEHFAAAYDHAGSSLSMLDRQTGRAIFWTRDAEALPQSERGAPFKTIFHWWAEACGSLLLHAAAVGYGSGAVLLVGEGGSGKSTTAFSCAAAGLNYLGDDYCAAGGQGAPYVFSLYGTGKLTAESALHFSAGATGCRERRAGEEKTIFYLHEIYPGLAVEGLPLRAILVPRFLPAATTTSVHPVPAVEAFKALAPSTISQLPGAGAATFRSLGRLVAQVPAFELLLARDFADIGAIVRRFLQTRLP
jgi:hypothetical protein